MDGGENISVVRLGSRQVRVLAHPLRVRLLAALRLDGPATATRLAAVLGTNTGATSYHLRQLADVGLVAEDAARNRGRERWWRAAHEMSTWTQEEFDADPDDRAAADWLAGSGARYFDEQLQRWLAARRSYPEQWRRAASFNDRMLRMSPDRLRALNDELAEVVQRHERVAAAEDAPGAAQVLLFLYSFPRPPEASP